MSYVDRVRKLFDKGNDEGNTSPQPNQEKLASPSHVRKKPILDEKKFSNSQLAGHRQSPKQPSQPKLEAGHRQSPRQPSQPKLEAGHRQSPRQPSQPKLEAGHRQSPRQPSQPKLEAGHRQSPRQPSQPKLEAGHRQPNQSSGRRSPKQQEVKQQVRRHHPKQVSKPPSPPPEPEPPTTSSIFDIDWSQQVDSTPKHKPKHSFTPASPASEEPYDLEVQSIVDYFQNLLNLHREDMELFRSEAENILETGSAAKQHQIIKKLAKVYKDMEYWRVCRLGHGAFGQVFVGIKRSNREQVAVKVIDLEEAKDDISVISREIQALAHCRGCPQLTNYYGSCVKGSELWIIMELLPGGSIQDKLRLRPISERHCAIIAREVLLGLKYLMQEGKFHRDIKAANILLAANGQVKLADFGATAQLTDTATKASTFVGSPFWMAPEVLMNQNYNEKADIWSLGISCIEMAKGKPPHSHLPPLRLISLIPNSPPPYLKGDFSEEFKHFVKACLIREPESRPSMYDLLKHPFIAKAGNISALVELI